jgi:glutamate dehydrogenase
MAEAQDTRSQRLDEILKLVRDKVAPDKRDMIERFVRRYFSQLDPEDLAERQPADLYGAALSHWNFARKRDPGSVRLRVFNPSIEEHGWQSTHTIIEIVNDDKPFLVDSVTMEVNRHGLTLHLIMHPIIAVKRGADGTLVDLAAEDDKDARHESFIRVEVDRIIEPARLAELAADLARVLDDVSAAVADWKAMRDRLLTILADTDKRPPPLPVDDLSEGKAFLAWLADNHFTFLGYRCHELVVQNGDDALKIVAGSSLGILRGDESKDVATSFAALPPEVKAYARRPELLVVTKATSRSTVHRPG